ncbi:NAD(P)-binding protein [Trichoderma compactum]
MAFTKLIIAGSTGWVADHAIRAILASTKPKFEVSILTRADSSKEAPSRPGAKLIAVDYNNHNQLLLLKAAQVAGVRRIFPSEYTLDILHPDAATLLTEGGNWPEDSSPVLTARKFVSLAQEGGPTSFTTLIPSAFMDGWLEGAFGSFDPKNRKVSVVDSGNFTFSGCTLANLGATIVAVLQMDEEKTKNRRIRISEIRTTMNEITETYEDILGTKFEKTHVNSQELLDQRNANLATGNPFGALFVTILVGAFNGCGAGDLADGLDFDGDGYLTLKKKTLKEMTVEALQKIGA